MPVNRDVFKIGDNGHAIRFGAKFLGTDGWGEKWAGDLPEKWDHEKVNLNGPVITNSEGKEFKVKRISFENPTDKEKEFHPEADKHHSQKCFWIEGI